MAFVQVFMYERMSGRELDWTKTNLCQAPEVLTLINAEVESQRGPSTAIHRWIHSKSEEPVFVDRFIEIRIALEEMKLVSQYAP